MQYWEVILDALIDTAKILPLLFIVYYIIELIEYKYALKFQNNKFLKGRASPVIGALLGCVPQCGFSVVTTDLYSRGSVSIGALIAVYIATSDEAIPLMISNPDNILWLLALIGIKIVLAILIGYLAMYLYKIIFKRKKDYISQNNSEKTVDNQNANSHERDKHIHAEDNHGDHNYEDLSEEHIHEDHAHVVANEVKSDSVVLEGKVESEEDKTKSGIDEHGGCCHHHVGQKTFDWLHPLLHCLKISAFILVINLLFGFITEIWIGEEALTNFLASSLYWQPVLAIIIGLIPNCVSSVVITELFLMGGLSFGSLVAGLMVNAGLGLIILLKQNKNWKENLFIILMLIIPSLIVGYALNFI